MIQTVLAATRTTTQRLARLSLLGVAWLAASACGVQDDLSTQGSAGSQEPATHLVQKEADLTQWENVAAGKLVTAQGPVSNNLQLLTDTVFAPESTDWNNSQYAVITPGGSALQIDLGQYYTISQLIVQADNNDYYNVESSSDGTNWTLLATIAPYGSWGLNTRPAINITSGGIARYLRILPTWGDGSYSVSELQAFANVYYPDPTNCCCTGTCGRGQMCPDVVCPVFNFH